VLGLRGGFGSWVWDVSVLRTDEKGSSWTDNSVDAAKVSSSLATTDPANSLNAFADGPGGSSDLLASLRAQRVVSRYSTGGTLVSGTLTGTLFSLPAGPIQVAAGGEARDEDMRFDGFVLASHGRSAWAAFSEVRVPIVSDAMGVPGAHQMALTVAARHDHYNDFGDTFNPQYGLTWAPISDLTLRVSYGTSFRPPSLFELYTPRTVAPSPLLVSDPRRNNESVNLSFITGGNPDLDPVEGESTTVGAVFTPGELKALRIATSYWRVRINDRVSVFAPAILLANEARFPERIVRGDPTPADVASGLPGPLLSVDSSRVNYGALKTSGVDFSALYVLSTKIGNFTPSVSATWVNDYTAVNVPNTPAVDRVGIAHFQGTIAEWRAIGSLSWSWKGVAASATAHYVPAYNDAIGVVPTGRKIPSQTLVDLQGSIDLGSGEQAWNHGLKITAGIWNVFDEEPNFSRINNTLGYDQSQADLRQRFSYIKVSKSF